jgi:hypothetical protein
MANSQEEQHPTSAQAVRCVIDALDKACELHGMIHDSGDCVSDNVRSSFQLRYNDVLQDLEQAMAWLNAEQLHCGLNFTGQSSELMEAVKDWHLYASRARNDPCLQKKRDEALEFMFDLYTQFLIRAQRELHSA